MKKEKKVVIDVDFTSTAAATEGSTWTFTGIMVHVITQTQTVKVCCVGGVLRWARDPGFAHTGCC